MVSRQSVSIFCSSSGSSASIVVATSPCRLTSVGKRIDSMPRVEVDLHPARLAFLGQELGIREARAEHQEGVAFHHQVVARLGPEQADRAGDPRQVVGQRCLAEQRLGAAGAELVGDRDDLVARALAPAPTSIATFLPLLSTSAARCRSRPSARLWAATSRRPRTPRRACAAVRRNPSPAGRWGRSARSPGARPWRCAPRDRSGGGPARAPSPCRMNAPATSLNIEVRSISCW